MKNKKNSRLISDEMIGFSLAVVAVGAVAYYWLPGISVVAVGKLMIKI